MKILTLILIALMNTSGSPAQGIRPKPKPTHEWLDRFQGNPEGWAQFQTVESTTEEFHRYVDEVFEPSGEIKEGIEDWKLFAVAFISVLLAEHHQLRDLRNEAVIETYGEPINIHITRKGSKLFQLFQKLCPPFYDGYRMVDGKRHKFSQVEILECYEYKNIYVWLMEGFQVLAISPRSERFDTYVKSQLKSEAQ